MERKQSAYPLFVKDPYFSVWANEELTNEHYPVFWTGDTKIMQGYVTIDGKKMFFLGKGQGGFRQTHIETKGFVTECLFESDILNLRLQYVSPLLLDELDVLSCPVCYLRYEAEWKQLVQKATIHFELEERVTYNVCRDIERKEKMMGTVTAFEGFECAVIGLRRQLPLSLAQDTQAPDWGYWYLSGETCSVEERKERTYACAVNTLRDRGFFMIAMDDIVSVNYFGRPLTGYYFRDGKTICDALQESYERADEIYEKCRSVYQSYENEWSRFGTEYVHICNAALIQTIGAHKLVRDYITGKTLFLSHECGSCACTGTLDVSYPSSPLFLKYNPELVRGMLYPIFEFAHKKVWTYPFAPHDVGVYPLVYGQYYALRCGTHKYAKSLWYEKEIFTLPKVYTDLVNKDYYDFEKQMPVEESANVLILVYAAYCQDGSKDLMEQEFPILKQWADYLTANGKYPEKQLSTDDFCGRKANNINLTIKASVALAAFANICEALDMDGKSYMDAAKELSATVESFGEQFKHLPATYDDNDDTYSLKYNLAFDLFFKFGLFSEKTYQKEAECYTKHMERYGVRLYSDINSTKSDWLVFVSCFKNDETYRTSIYRTIERYMRETQHRVPFPDWYDVEVSDKRESSLFRNRTVQGGVFIPLLMETR